MQFSTTSELSTFCYCLFLFSFLRRNCREIITHNSVIYEEVRLFYLFLEHILSHYLLHEQILNSYKEIFKHAHLHDSTVCLTCRFKIHENCIPSFVVFSALV
jgi:hypothetical protein